MRKFAGGSEESCCDEDQDAKIWYRAVNHGLPLPSGDLSSNLPSIPP
ncbi:MAG: hypothetical protein K2H15_03315 [Muribaculaceae bacterium]|nr:hypothetical protein [Muribaculaceae bacterium]